MVAIKVFFYSNWQFALSFGRGRHLSGLVMIFSGEIHLFYGGLSFVCRDGGRHGWFVVIIIDGEYLGSDRGEENEKTVKENWKRGVDGTNGNISMSSNNRSIQGKCRAQMKIRQQQDQDEQNPRWKTVQAGFCRLEPANNCQGEYEQLSCDQILKSDLHPTAERIYTDGE